MTKRRGISNGCYWDYELTKRERNGSHFIFTLFYLRKKHYQPVLLEKLNFCFNMSCYNNNYYNRKYDIIQNIKKVLIMFLLVDIKSKLIEH